MKIEGSGADSDDLRAMAAMALAMSSRELGSPTAAVQVPDSEEEALPGPPDLQSESSESGSEEAFPKTLRDPQERRGVVVIA